MNDFGLKQKFIDGTPVPDDYAKMIAAFNRSVWECNITEDDELTMGPYWITPFRIDRVVRGTCSQCHSETEIQIGHDLLISDIQGTRTLGPLKAIEECPECGTSDLDPTPYNAPHNERL